MTFNASFAIVSLDTPASDIGCPLLGTSGGDHRRLAKPQDRVQCFLVA